MVFGSNPVTLTLRNQPFTNGKWLIYFLVGHKLYEILQRKKYKQEEDQVAFHISSFYWEIYINSIKSIINELSCVNITKNFWRLKESVYLRGVKFTKGEKWKIKCIVTNIHIRL